MPTSFHSLCGPRLDTWAVAFHSVTRHLEYLTLGKRARLKWCVTMPQGKVSQSERSKLALITNHLLPVERSILPSVPMHLFMPFSSCFSAKIKRQLYLKCVLICGQKAERLRFKTFASFFPPLTPPLSTFFHLPIFPPPSFFFLFLHPNHIPSPFLFHSPLLFALYFYPVFHEYNVRIERIPKKEHKLRT